MQLEVFALCDAATDQMGKLNILGAFDRVGGELPMVLPQCAVVLRIRWDRVDAGNHTLLLQFQDLRGIPLVPPLESQIGVPSMPAQLDSHAVNLVLNMQRLHVEREGKYVVMLRIDNIEIARIPLYVEDATPKEPNPHKQ